MQEKFVLKARNAVKRAVAISTSALMLGMTMTAAAAYDLGDYPAPFVEDGQWSSLIVVGTGGTNAAGLAADLAGAVDIAARLAQESVSTAGGAVTIEGAKTKDLAIGVTLVDSSTGFATALDDDDIAGLSDSSLSLDNGSVSDTYDYHEEIRMDQGLATNISLETGLTYTNKDQDFLETVFLAVPRQGVEYRFAFDEDLVAGNLISDSSTTYPIEISFLGQNLKLTGAGSDGDDITAEIGTEYFLNIGDTVTVDDHIVELTRVGSSSAIVDCDGTTYTISATSKTTCTGVKVKVNDFFDTTDPTQGAANLLIGADTTKSYDNGDAFIGENKDDPDWVWRLSGLNETGKASIILGVTYDNVIDDPTDNAPIVGDAGICLPNDYGCVALDSYTKTDYKKYTIEVTTGEQLYHAYGDTTAGISSAKCIHLHGDGGDKNAFLVGTTYTDDLCLYNDGPSVDIYTKDHDHANKYVNASTAIGALAADATDVQTNDTVSIRYKDSTITIDSIVMNASTNVDNMTLIFDEQADDLGTGQNLNVFFDINAAAFEYLGSSDGDTVTARDVHYNNTDISGWKENTRTQKGIIIYDPDSSSSSDKLELDVPSDINDFKVNIVVSGPSTTTTTTVGSNVNVNSIAGVNLVALDTEVTDKTSKALILVGGPAVNALSAEALGVPYPSYGADSTIPTEKGLIKIVEDAFGGTNVALVVAGWEAANTRDAANVLKDFTTYAADLAGMTEVAVTGTTVTAVPTVAAEPEAPADDAAADDGTE